MICPNCGTTNIDGSSFCIKCGSSLQVMQQTPINPIPNQNVEQVQQPMMQPEQPVIQQNYNQNIVEPQINSQNSNVSTASLNYLMYILAVLTKPIKGFKDEEAKLNNTKTAFIFTLIVTAAMTIINLFKTIISVVRVYDFSFSKGDTYSWQWENLKDIKFVEVIGKNFLIYACAILSIAIVFYIGSLIIKKQLNFIKSLSIATTSIIPAVIGFMILSPLGNLIWEPLSIIFSVAGLTYSLIILYELINNELKLEGDMKVYFNLACFGLLIFAGYFAYMKLFMPSVSSGINEVNDLLDFFN